MGHLHIVFVCCVCLSTVNELSSQDNSEHITVRRMSSRTQADLESHIPRANLPEMGAEARRTDISGSQWWETPVFLCWPTSWKLRDGFPALTS